LIHLASYGPNMIFPSCNIRSCGHRFVTPGMV
jgi:hypothetical protein